MSQTQQYFQFRQQQENNFLHHHHHLDRSSTSSSHPSRQRQHPRQDVSQLLQFVADGDEIEAQELVQANENLLNLSGDVTDLSGRTFKNITAFQYALWALDWNMWEMLLNNLEPAQEARQVQNYSEGSWIQEHGEHAGQEDGPVRKLIQGLEECARLWSENRMAEADRIWVEQVGRAQSLLPVHVVNEYCHERRSFHPVPDFTESENYGPWRTRQTKSGEWYTCRHKGGRLGESFAIGRAGTLSYCLTGSREFRGPTSLLVQRIQLDIKGLTELLNVRLNQRQQVFQEFTN